MTHRLLRMQTAILLAITIVFSPLFSFIDHLNFTTYEAKAEGVDVTWDGGGANNNWSTANNWSTNQVPTPQDNVIFNNTSTKDLTINANIRVNSIDIQTGYTGTITLGSSIITTSSYTQADGTFTGGSGNIIVKEDFTLNGGTFTSTNETLTVVGDFDAEGGTFNHNDGTLSIASTSDRIIKDLPDLNNLKVGDGLVGYWKFDEGEGTIAFDSIRSNNMELINDPTWTTDTPDISIDSEYS
jgi:hypothetical protein